MYLSVGGLFVIVVIVFYQVFGRYVLNSSPTWTESFALVLMLYVTLIGAAVGVRDAGHIGMESLLVLVSEKIRNRIELVIHVLVIVFGATMIYNGLVLGSSVWSYKIPNLGSAGSRSLRAAGDLGRADHPVLDRARHRAASRARRSSRHGTDHSRHHVLRLPRPRRAGGVRDRACPRSARSSTRGCRWRCSSSR